MTNTISIGEPEVRRKTLEGALRETLSAFNHRDELEVEPMADPLDEGRWAMEREIAGWTLDQKARHMREIRAALDRLGEGTFGTCERCEEQIGQKRLAAVPWATLCVFCQNEAERSQNAITLLHQAA